MASNEPEQELPSSPCTVQSLTRIFLEVGSDESAGLEDVELSTFGGMYCGMAIGMGCLVSRVEGTVRLRRRSSSATTAATTSVRMIARAAPAAIPRVSFAVSAPTPMLRHLTILIPYAIHISSLDHCVAPEKQHGDLTTQVYATPPTVARLLVSKRIRREVREGSFWLQFWPTRHRMPHRRLLSSCDTQRRVLTSPSGALTMDANNDPLSFSGVFAELPGGGRASRSTAPVIVAHE